MSTAKINAIVGPVIVNTWHGYSISIHQFCRGLALIGLLSDYLWKIDGPFWQTKDLRVNRTETIINWMYMCDHLTAEDHEY